jgi:hypothetical protein
VIQNPKAKLQEVAEEVILSNLQYFKLLIMKFWIYCGEAFM